MARPQVLLTNPIDPIGMAILEAAADVVTAPDNLPATLNRMAADTDLLVVRAFLPADIFDGPNRLRGVVRHGVGLDMIPMESATAHAPPRAYSHSGRPHFPQGVYPEPVFSSREWTVAPVVWPAHARSWKRAERSPPQRCCRRKATASEGTP